MPFDKIVENTLLVIVVFALVCGAAFGPLLFCITRYCSEEDGHRYAQKQQLVTLLVAIGLAGGAIALHGQIDQAGPQWWLSGAIAGFNIVAALIIVSTLLFRRWRPNKA